MSAQSRVGIVAPSAHAADAGRRIAAAGGNAVDAAIAATLVALVSEPGVVSFGAGAFLTIWPPGGDPVSIDAGSEMPGRGKDTSLIGRGERRVGFDYGGGMETIVGHASVATPGAPAGLALASDRYGQRPWDSLFEPAIEISKSGFPLSQASSLYLNQCAHAIYDWNPNSYAALRHDDGQLKQQGETVFVEHLAESLEKIAREGVDVFYRGEIAERMVSEIAANDGLLSAEDLAAYEPRIEPALCMPMDRWTVATSQPPAIGGAILMAMMGLAPTATMARWDDHAVKTLVDAQRAALGLRRERIDAAENIEQAVRDILIELGNSGHSSATQSPSTIHVSTVDSDGLACAITASAGYGSGVMPDRTGIWLNNSLGEIELNLRGFHCWETGQRLLSNMAPTVARRDDGALLAIGSPGADRITSAIHQVLLGFAHFGLPLSEAVSHPRVHYEIRDGQPCVAYEDGAAIGGVDEALRRFDGLSMFFGGVGAALFVPPAHFELAADPRRVGRVATA